MSRDPIDYGRGYVVESHPASPIERQNSTGQFLPRDPANNRLEDVNQYRYVKNNPLDKTDPSGFACCSLTDLLVGDIMKEAEKRRGTASKDDDSAHHCWAVCEASKRFPFIGALGSEFFGCIGEALAPSSDWREDMIQNTKGALCGTLPPPAGITCWSCDRCCGTYDKTKPPTYHIPEGTYQDEDGGYIDPLEWGDY